MVLQLQDSFSINLCRPSLFYWTLMADTTCRDSDSTITCPNFGPHLGPVYPFYLSHHHGVPLGLCHLEGSHFSSHPGPSVVLPSCTEIKLVQVTVYYLSYQIPFSQFLFSSNPNTQCFQELGHTFSFLVFGHKQLLDANVISMST